ncbi:MAG: NgoFVII family restriction endonuclease [Acidimicrobiia bacterium]|nr:NgoFVII family restriction endonuclease [Acidimicrobiia bacterium]
MPRILDNLSEGTDNQMEASLLQTLRSSRSLDSAVGYFNLRGWGLISDSVSALPGAEDGTKARVLVGSTEDPQREMRRLLRTRPSPPVDGAAVSEAMQEALAEFRAQLEVGIPTPSDENQLRLLKCQIERGEVDLRMCLAHRLHAKLYLAHRDDQPVPRIGYVGSSNLTGAGLREKGELNVDVTDITSTQLLADWFEKLWSDRFTLEANPELVEILDRSWAGEEPLPPYLIHLKMAYHLSREAREGLISFGLPTSMADQLLKFQEAAVKIAARIVIDKGGAMIGDVVGLGKTMVATAIARLLQEDQGWETLIVCPKNLVPMWEDYRHRYRLHGEVLSLSMVTRELTSKPRHRLLIVDESHNLRNPKRKDHQALTKYIQNNESRVLLLSATPYNKSLEDLDSQLSLFLNDHQDLGIRPEKAIEKAGEDPFAIACEGLTSSLAAFRRSEELEDWQTLMSQFMVRRTRRFIEDNYAEEDEQERKYLTFGKRNRDRFYFPEREAHPIERIIDDDDPAARMMSDQTLDQVRDLKRPRYSFANYLTDAEPADQEGEKLLEDLKLAGGSVAGFNRIMMYKRLTSSGPAFLLTLKRHQLRDRVTLYAMESGLPVPIGDIQKAVWDSDLGTEDDGLFRGHFDNVGVDYQPAEAYRKLQEKPPSKLRWLPTRHLDSRFAQDLAHDIRVIDSLLERFGNWDQTKDGKINTLVKLIQETHPGEKVLVFTEYSDTADYVSRALEERNIERVARVTGQDGNATMLARRFSPGTHPFVLDEVEEELQVLVSTDVLSEGQNLQDARIVVNYDLPWAIIKLVQRAGRVDRIGQQSEKVLLYSLLPADRVEEKITLRKRIRDRLGDNARLLGSDEQFFGDDKEQEAVKGIFTELSEWDHAPSEDVDPASMAYEIWRQAEEDHPELAKQVENLPNVVYATLRPEQEETVRALSGVVVHTQTVTGSDTFVVVSENGKARRISPQEALRITRCEPETPPAPPRSDHLELVAQAFEGPITSPPDKTAVVPIGIRGRCYEKLKDYSSQPQLELYVSPEDLDQALEQLRRFPLMDRAAQLLSIELRSNSQSGLAARIVDLYKEQMLCRLPDPSRPRSEPRVICSMGFDPPG